MISLSKFNPLYEGLNSVARKVYNVTPMAEPWTVQQVYNELERQGIRLDYRAVHGALGAMATNGLLRERPKGSFQREALRPPTAKTEPTIMEVAMTKAQETTTAPTQPSPVKPDPMARLEAIATRLSSLSQEVAELAEDVADAVIDVQAMQEAGSEEMQKLRQLKQLLQGL